MKTTSKHSPFGELWNSIQSWLLPMLEDEIGELDEKHRQFVAVCELLRTARPRGSLPPQMGIVVQNPDVPDRPINSPHWCYQLSDAAQMGSNLKEIA